MTPQLAARLRVHEKELTDAESGSARMGGALIALPTRWFGSEDGDREHSSVLRRESRHRRLLGVADVLAAGIAPLIVFAVISGPQPALAGLCALPLVLLLFKVAGLYDRDQLRLVHSTL